MVLFTQLPSDFSATSLAIRSSLQDIRFYIDGVLRVEYSTGGTRLSGKTSASRYVFCPTSAADAGKELRIELTTLLILSSSGATTEFNTVWASAPV